VLKYNAIYLFINALKVVTIAAYLADLFYPKESLKKTFKKKLKKIDFEIGFPPIFAIPKRTKQFTKG